MIIKLVSNENISWRLKKLLPQWEILPSNEIKLGERLTDAKIWKFAKTNGYSVLTFDEDFSELQNLYGFPPKIIWLRTGNVTTTEITNVLRSYQDEIVKFLKDSDWGIFEIYA